MMGRGASFLNFLFQVIPVHFNISLFPAPTRFFPNCAIMAQLWEASAEERARFQSL